jgi:transcriptional regulator with XRE-family HTH domain
VSDLRVVAADHTKNSIISQVEILATSLQTYPNGGESQMMARKYTRRNQRITGPQDIQLGKRIRLRRLEQKKSQDAVGKAIGVSVPQVQKYENGVNRVGASRLQQIATALDVPVTFFYDDASAGRRANSDKREVESLLFLDSAFSLRLLRAYSSMKDKTVQRLFVALVESIAAGQ